MENGNDLLELAKRCEQADGPDRDLDIAIWLACEATDNYRNLIQTGRTLHGESEAEFRAYRLMDGKSYTGSTDTALTLAPKRAKVTTQSFGGPGPMALVDPNERFCSAATLPLAICAAALRAQAAKQDAP